MAKKKKLYLVWQESGSYDMYDNKLCGVYDDEEKALGLKAILDEKVITSDRCWNIMPEEVFSQWPTVEIEGGDTDDFEYVSEFKGYTLEQRELQEERWCLMTNEYKVAVVEIVNMNEEL